MIWHPTRPLQPGEWKGTLMMVLGGLTVSYLLAASVGLLPTAAFLLCLAAFLGLAAIGWPDWLSQVLRRVPSRGLAPKSDPVSRSFLVAGALAALAFGAAQAIG